MNPRVKMARACLLVCVALMATALMACSAAGSTPIVSATLTPTPPPTIAPLGTQAATSSFNRTPTPTAPPTHTPLGTQAATPTFTRTPTPVVVAVEMTPSPGATRAGGVVWDVVITSKTSRQFIDFQKGTVNNTCFTNWRFALFYVVSPNGTLQGHGSGATQTPLSCSPHPLPDTLATSEEEVSVDGTQDNQTLKLRLGVKSFKPNPSGDNGGLVLLFSSGACPAVRRTIQIPIDKASPDNFQFKLSDQGQLTGCGGSGKDVVMAESVFEVERDFDCASVPPNFDQAIIDLCR